MENKVRFKLHKVKKQWITIAASSLAIGASLIGLGQIGADEVKPETTAVNSPENVVSDSNLETSASLITRTEVAPASTTVNNVPSETVSTVRLVSLQKQLLNSLPVKLIRGLNPFNLVKQLQPIEVLKPHPKQATTQLLHRKHLHKVENLLLMTKATGIT